VICCIDFLESQFVVFFVFSYTFTDRYPEAYRLELEHFIDLMTGKETVPRLTHQVHKIIDRFQLQQSQTLSYRFDAYSLLSAGCSSLFSDC
jgi:hypothetical protein